MYEIRYNANHWCEKDYKKVFGITSKSLVDIEMDGKYFEKCKLDFYYVGAGFFQIRVKVPGEISGVMIHDGCIYPRKPFFAYAARRSEIKIHFKGHSYQWKCGDKAECSFCGKAEKNIDDCKFYIDDQETAFSGYIKNSITIE